MKKTLLSEKPLFPKEFSAFTENSRIYDSSCSPEARVYFIECDGGYYLKRAQKGSLACEAAMTEYFHSKSLATDVIAYISDDYDWMLTRSVRGKDCCDSIYTKDPKKLCDTIAYLLRELHETDIIGCPVPDHTSIYFDTINSNYEKGCFDPDFLPQGYEKLSAEETRRLVDQGRSLFKNDALLHGDYCLPNIMLDNWNFSAFIDLDHAGIGNRHVDLFWGAWTLNFNLKTDAFRDRFFDAYGRDKIDKELLRIVALAECFG